MLPEKRRRKFSFFGSVAHFQPKIVTGASERGKANGSTDDWKRMQTLKEHPIDRIECKKYPEKS